MIVFILDCRNTVIIIYFLNITNCREINQLSKYIKENSISVGFNPSSGQDFFDSLTMYWNYIHDYFFDMSRDIAGNHLKVGSVYSILSKCNTYDIPANLLFNNYSSFDEYHDKIKMAMDVTNLKSVTVLNPDDAVIVKNNYPQLETHLSVRFWDWGRFPNPIARLEELKSKSIDVINISGAYSYNDFEMIDRIHDLGMKVKFITNEGCIINKDFNYSQFPEFRDCMCRTNPFSAYACWSQCRFVYQKYPWMELSRNNIYKESLQFYDIDIYKISGRHRSISTMINYLNYWTSDNPTSVIYPSWTYGIDVSNNYDAFLEYIDIRANHCSGYCYKCQKCKKYWEIFVADQKIDKKA